MLLDDDEKIKNCGRYSGVGNSHKAEEISGDVIVAIGDSAARKRIQEGVEEERLVILTHSDAVIAEDAVIGRGTIVIAGAVINHGSVIGRGCIVNTCASVDHDCKLEDCVHVAVGAHIAGHVKIGKGT